MDPDPGGPKTYGSYGYGSATLIIAQLQEQLDGTGTESKEPVGCVWYRPRIVTRHLDKCAGARMLPVVAVAVVGIVAIAGGGSGLEMVACSTQQ